MKKVLVFGSFDVLHEGHLDFFRQAKALGDWLVVVVARDENVEKAKNRKPLHGERRRLKEVAKARGVNKAVLGGKKDKYAVIRKEKPAVIALGYDQEVDLKELKNKVKEFGLNAGVARLKAFKPKEFKSSVLKKANKKTGNWKVKRNG